MNVTELETPSVIINLPRMEHNIAAMQAHCDSLGLRFRPHIKTHKVLEIARMQLDAGAIGIACQKVSEAQVFAEAGFDDILIPYNLLGIKAQHAADLALFNRLAVTADSMTTVRELSASAAANGLALRVLVELITDQERAGTTVEGAVALAEQIEKDEHLHFAGLLVYPSNVSVRPGLQYVINRLHVKGIGVEIVSGGGVGAAYKASEVPELTELRVGTYVFNDYTTVLHGYATLENCAMTVRATVVSRPTPTRCILDSGSKTLSSETIDDGSGNIYGFILEHPQARIYKLNEEHAYVDCGACDPPPRIGDIVHIVPIHTCVVSNLHDTLYGVRDGEVEATWRVAARGKVW